MKRAFCIFLVSFIAAFSFQDNTAESTTTYFVMSIEEAAEQQSDLVCGHNHIQTALSEFRENSRQPLRIITLLKHSSPSLSKCISNSTLVEYSNTEYPPSVTENFIVTLHKFRI